MTDSTIRITAGFTMGRTSIRSQLSGLARSNQALIANCVIITALAMRGSYLRTSNLRDLSPGPMNLNDGLSIVVRASTNRCRIADALEHVAQQTEEIAAKRAARCA